MSEDLTQKNLAGRIAAKRAEDEAILTSYREGLTERAKIEFEIAEREYKSCGSKLRASVRAEHEHTRSAFEENLRALRSGFARKMFWSLMIGVLFVFAVAGGLRGLISYLSRDIQQKIELRRALTVQIEQQQRTVERLRETTWGVVLTEDEQGRRFVTLPQGTLEGPARYLYLGGSVIRLSSE